MQEWVYLARTHIALGSCSSVLLFPYTNSCGAQSAQAFTITVPGTTGTPITPYISVNGGGSWAEESSATVSSTSTVVDLGPQPLSGGSWSWTGPNGFTSTARQINSIPLSVGTNTYVVTYTNPSGGESTETFVITAT